MLLGRGAVLSCCITKNRDSRAESWKVHLSSPAIPASSPAFLLLLTLSACTSAPPRASTLARTSAPSPAYTAYSPALHPTAVTIRSHHHRRCLESLSASKERYEERKEQSRESSSRLSNASIFALTGYIISSHRSRFRKHSLETRPQHPSSLPADNRHVLLHALLTCLFKPFRLPLVSNAISPAKLLHSPSPPLQDILPLDPDPQRFGGMYQSVDANRVIRHVVVHIAVHHGRGIKVQYRSFIELQ